ncbi:MAG: methyltransferase domain-containing protein [Candidatus Nealsonbacteria bacterium]
MNFLNKNLNILACPVCKNNLEIKIIQESEQKIIFGFLSCYSCKRKFEIKNNVPCLIPNIFNQINAYKEWNKKQKYGLEAYQNPDLNYKKYISVIKKMFGNFCEHQGNVLDIGSGINNRLDYFDQRINEKVNFIGLDPLLGNKNRNYFFLQGIGEYLPFLNESIDQVIIAGTLDHFINPEIVLKEVKRVLKKGGEINIWISIFNPDFQEKRDLIKRAFGLIKKGYIKRLVQGIKQFSKEVFLKSEDKYHFNRFSEKEIILIFNKLKMEIKRFIILNENGKYLFLKVKKYE